MQLLEHPLSPYVIKVKLALREKGVAFERLITLGAAADHPALKGRNLNPRAEVPVLIDTAHGNTAVYDSSVIVEYLEERFSQPMLLPADPAARARSRLIEDVCDTHIEAVIWALNEIVVFRRAEGELRDKLIKAANEQLQTYFAWLSRELGSQPFFGGAQFGAADCAVLPLVSSASAFKVTPPADSALAKWWARVKERPSVRATLAEYQQGIKDTRTAPPPPGKFRRQYRDHRLEWLVANGGVQIILDGLKKDNIRFHDHATFAKL
eukprot:Unigene5264_Nuclearia_a/m.16162 Unigene5264_Nuclearia_a/g.16162  ORF Unigene5264_Nuclearia_a/g.16162 Unigene5264_Nuclearia_a/m.16162 type:complete len:266 (+) Unigene5264_Nuclearia_a:67-864(+)